MTQALVLGVCTVPKRHHAGPRYCASDKHLPRILAKAARQED
jgi:hypothetical protein